MGKPLNWNFGASNLQEETISFLLFSSFSSFDLRDRGMYLNILDAPNMTQRNGGWSCDLACPHSKEQICLQIESNAHRRYCKATVDDSRNFEINNWFDTTRLLVLAPKELKKWRLISHPSQGKNNANFEINSLHRPRTIRGEASTSSDPCCSINRKMAQIVFQIWSNM